MLVADKVGKTKPAATGKLGGAEVFSYVWPTKIDSAAVGLEPNQGVLALAVTAHPDFDDTPPFDENRDGDRDNDGNIWHTHWVVLVPDNTCGPGPLHRSEGCGRPGLRRGDGRAAREWQHPCPSFAR